MHALSVCRRSSAPYATRRELLDVVVNGVARRHHDSGLRTVGRSVSSPDGPLLWAFVQQHDLEGLVAKRTIFRYTAGRSKSWVKLRNTQRLLAVVAGHQPGAGARATTFGNLQLAVLAADGAVVRVGEVHGGFTRAQLLQVGALLRARRPFVVEVEYLTVTADRNLRMPTFVALRPDVDALDCRIEQLHRTS